MTNVLLAIEAETGPHGLPFELVAGKTVLDRVIEAAKKAALYLNNAHGGALKAKVLVLCPRGDRIAEEFQNRCEVLQGPLRNVLDSYSPKYVARLSYQSPLIPPFVISKLVTLAHMNGYDLVANHSGAFATAPAGTHCTVVSARFLEAGAGLEMPLPTWAKMGLAVNHFDLSGIDYAVKEPSDLPRVRDAFNAANDKYQRAVLTFGHHAVHKI